MASKKYKKIRKSKDNDSKPNLKEKVTEALELPKEIVLNMPKITMLGVGELIIDNYKGVVEYSNSRIRINTSIGVIIIRGTNLIIRSITSEDIVVNGEISGLEFLK